ncbi:MAG: AMP-binding protein [Oscillospiraceae bacterium]|nr:AMP-binding protein [Oscillospiraceae bacterium]
MSIYQKFCTETFDETNRLTHIELNYPENFNFGYDVVDAIAAQEPDRRAIVWANPAGQERIVSFGEVARISNQYANVFLAAGLGRGSRVMVALKRHVEYWFTAIALHKIGAVMMPVTHMLTEEDIAYRFRQARPSAVICTVENEFPRKIQAALAQTDMEALLWTAREPTEGFRCLSQEAETASDLLPRQETLAHDPMFLYFTSGTTEYPKGVIHDQTYPLAHIVTAKYWQQAEDGGLHFTVSETGWAKASWGKLYGQWLVGSAVMVYDFDSFSPRQLVSVINKYGVTSFCAPSTVYRYLVRKTIDPMPTLKHATTAGEVLSPDVFRLFYEKTGLTLAEGYGQTETTLLLANFAWSAPKDASLGYPSPLYDIQLQAPDGSPVPDGEVGEIVIRPPENGVQCGLLTAYWENQELLANVWRNGVYHTGDAAWRDEDGCYWFFGRFDDIIKTGGYRVGPYEIERVLAEHPAVLECSVIGIPDKWRGQAIKAIIVPTPQRQPDRALEKEIMDFANARLAEYKWIRSIEFVSSMPKTISGKICRASLKEERDGGETAHGGGTQKK